MNLEKLKQGGVDYEDGIHRFCDNNAMYEKYLRKLITLPLYGELQQSLSAGNYTTAFEACHKLKAFVGNLSIPGLFDSICALTDLLRGGTPAPEQLTAQLAQTDAQYQQVTAAIKEALADE